MNQDMNSSDAELKEIITKCQKAFGDGHIRHVTLRADFIERIAQAELQRRQSPASVLAELAKAQPCGCVVCTCADEIQCQDCGAKNCGTHPVGQFPTEAYGREQVQWIACKERNPSERGSYLAVHNYGGVPEVRITNYGTSKKWNNGRDKLLPPEYRISHWMPLPEPPTC